MALNFPNSPTLNQVYTDSTSGFSYQWNGTVWISFSPSSSGQIKILDDFSASFNNSTQTFALTSGSVSITPPRLMMSDCGVGGIIETPLVASAKVCVELLKEAEKSSSILI